MGQLIHPKEKTVNLTINVHVLEQHCIPVGDKISRAVYKIA